MREFVVTHHQPSFLPWVGYWNKMAVCTHWSYLVGVGFAKRDYQNRVALNGSWLTVPVRAGLNEKIQDVCIAGKYKHKIATTIKQNLMNKKMPYGHRLEELVHILETIEPKYLYELCMSMDAMIVASLGLEKTYSLSGAGNVAGDTKTKGLSRRLASEFPPNVDTYLLGAGTSSYFVKEEFQYDCKLMVQKIAGWAEKDTILKVLATVNDPLSYVMEAATWEEL